MSLFDAILGLNSTENSNAATNAANNGINSTAQSNAQTLWNTTTNAQDFLTNGANQAGDLIRQYGGDARRDLTGNNQSARDAIAGGVNSSTKTLRDSNGNFVPWLANGQNANGMLSDALGLNGANGNAAATGAFQAGPGYRWQVDQATDAAARKAASLGMAASGNTLDAITRLGSNLANQSYGSWMDRLNNVSGQGLSAANSMNGNNQAIANIQNGGGKDTAGLLDRLGSQLGTLDANQGNTLAGLRTGLGSGLAGLQSGMGRDMAANNWHGTDAIAGNMINQGRTDDSAQNANNGVFSRMFGQLGGSLFNAGQNGAFGSGIANALSFI